MLDKLRKLADMVYENHNKISDKILNEDYTVENVTMYVYQDKDRISISALNIDTQRQIDITAKKYSRLFKSYNTIAKINYSLKDLPKVIIELLEQEEKVQEDKTETHYKLGYKYKKDGSIHYRDFPRMQFVNQWLNQGKEKDMIKVSLEEFKVQKIKTENTNTDDSEFIEYLKAKFGRNYINKTKKALEQLEEIKDKRSLAGRKQKFDKEQINKILELREDGRTIKELSVQFKCGVATIHKLISENR